MAALPTVSGERAVRVFLQAGWNKDRQRGSQCPSIAEIAPGTLRALIRAAGMSVDEFVALV